MYKQLLFWENRWDSVLDSMKKLKSHFWHSKIFTDFLINLISQKKILQKQ